jgi:hypothetical protein
MQSPLDFSGWNMICARRVLKEYNWTEGDAALVVRLKIQQYSVTIGFLCEFDIYDKG